MFSRVYVCVCVCVCVLACVCVWVFAWNNESAASGIRYLILYI